MNTVSLRCEGNESFSLFTEEQGTIKWRYRLRAVPVSREEFEKHWLHSFSLNSMEHVMLSRADEAGRLYYRKNRIELVQPDQRIKQTIAGYEFDSLSNLFGVPADLIQEANRVLTR
jgi:hypothetical protein